MRGPAASKSILLVLLAALVFLGASCRTPSQVVEHPNSREVASAPTPRMESDEVSLEPSRIEVPEVALATTARRVEKPPVRKPTSKPRKPKTLHSSQPEKPPTPKSRTASEASSKKRYPRAKPRTIGESGDPENAKRAAKEPETKSKGGADGARLRGQASWEALPASGSPMNAMLLFEFIPGNPRPTEDVRHNLTVILDVSHSMPLPIREVLSALIPVSQELRLGDRLTLVAFADLAEVFSGDGRFLEEELANPGVPFGLGDQRLGDGTDLLAAIEAATRQTVQNEDIDLELFVLVTDGYVEQQKRCLLVSRRANVPISTIGVGDDCDRWFLEDIANATSGRFYFLSESKEFPQILKLEHQGFLGTLAHDCQLKVTLGSGVKVNAAYLLEPCARATATPKVQNQTLSIPLQDLRKGETASIALQVTLPPHRSGSVTVASASVEYTLPPAKLTMETAPEEVSVRYSETLTRPKTNTAMRGINPRIQKLVSDQGRNQKPSTSLEILRRSRRQSKSKPAPWNKRH